MSHAVAVKRRDDPCAWCPQDDLNLNLKDDVYQDKLCQEKMSRVEWLKLLNFGGDIAPSYLTMSYTCFIPMTVRGEYKED